MDIFRRLLTRIKSLFSALDFNIKTIASAVVFAIIIPVLAGYVNKILSFKPESLSVYVVSNFKENSSKQMKKAFKDAFDKDLFIGEVKVKLVTNLSDEGSTSRAAEISRDIANDNGSLMVVGHFSSTETKAALPAYLDADPKVPVILTTETNPSLVPYSRANDEFNPILRLSPDDIDQARSAAEFASNPKNGGESFWVVEDTANSVYSKQLALSFIENIRDKGKKVVLYTLANELPDASTLQKLQIDSVFYAGEWSNALILIRQLRAIFPTNLPTVILSDAAVDENLLTKGGEDTEGIHVMFQMSAVDYEKEKYGAYGTEAAIVVNKLIEEADTQYNNQKRSIFQKMFIPFTVSDARESVSKAMKHHQKAEYTIDGNLNALPFYFESSTGKKIYKKASGIEEPTYFNIWRVENVGGKMKFVDI